MGGAFRLDAFQRAAIAALDLGRNVLVAAPTGSGKTVVAEHAVAAALAAGRRAFYTTPIKALSNQKFADLIGIHGAEHVGLLTGDASIRPGAQVVVMTTEVVRNMLYTGTSLDDLDVIVLDEVHFLQDAYRGPVWEEVLLHAPPHVRFVCLSATVSNADELGAWLELVRGPTEVVVETERPVQLEHHVLARDRATARLVMMPTLVGGRPNPDGARLDAAAGPPRRRGPAGGRPRMRFGTPRRDEVVDLLASNDLLPALWFVFSRAGCDDAARSCADAGIRLTTPDERRRIAALVEEHLGGLADADLEALDHRRFVEVLECGIAAHHAGMVPPFKELVEACFIQGLVKLVFATETLALGLNMPARCTVLERLSKFTGERHSVLSPAEYTQLAGRAGRRGIDETGTAVVLWSPFLVFDEVASLVSSRSFNLRSAFRPTYNMAVNLIGRYAEDQADRTLNRSFAQYQADRSVVRLERRVDRRVEEVERLRAELGEERDAVDSYRLLLRAARGEEGSGRRRDAAVDEALGRCRPGDVLQLDRLTVAVLAATRRKGGAMLRVVDARARTRTAHAAEFSRAPEVIGRIDVPTPYAPRQRNFQEEVARRLARAVRDGRLVASGEESNPPEGVTDAPDRHEAARLVESHPLHRSTGRDALVRLARRLEHAEADVAAMRLRVESVGDTLGRQFRRVVDLLRRRGYVTGWSLTDHGAVLARIYHESDLLVAEALNAGLLDDLEPPALAAVASCLTYEHRSRDLPPPPSLPGAVAAERWRALRALADDLVLDEERHRLPPTRRPDPTFAGAAAAWCRGASLEDVLLLADLSGGDVVRNMKQLIDLLRQVGQIAPNSETAASARRTVARLDRGVVALASANRGAS